MRPKVHGEEDNHGEQCAHHQKGEGVAKAAQGRDHAQLADYRARAPLHHPEAGSCQQTEGTGPESEPASLTEQDQEGGTGHGRD